MLPSFAPTTAAAAAVAAAAVAAAAAAGVEFLWKLELNRQLLVLLDDAETAVAVRAETALAAVQKGLGFRVIGFRV